MNQAAQAAAAFLGDHHVLSLALVDAEGLPHACSLMYALDGVTLYWLSDPRTRHSRLIDAGGAVPAMATVAPDYADFRAIRGLQLFGTASRTTGLAEAAAARARIVARYGLPAVGPGEAGRLAQALVGAVAYRLVPERLVFIDNRQSFGSKTALAPADFAS